MHAQAWQGLKCLQARTLETRGLSNNMSEANARVYSHACVHAHNMVMG